MTRILSERALNAMLLRDDAIKDDLIPGSFAQASPITVNRLGIVYKLLDQVYPNGGSVVATSYQLDALRQFAAHELSYVLAHPEAFAQFKDQNNDVIPDAVIVYLLADLIKKINKPMPLRPFRLSIGTSAQRYAAFFSRMLHPKRSE